MVEQNELPSHNELIKQRSKEALLKIDEMMVSFLEARAQIEEITKLASGESLTLAKFPEQKPTVQETAANSEVMVNLVNERTQKSQHLLDEVRSILKQSPSQPDTTSINQPTEELTKEPVLNLTK